MKYASEEYSNYVVPGIISLMGLIMFALNPLYRNIWITIGFVAIFGLSFIYREVASKALEQLSQRTLLESQFGTMLFR